MRSNPLQSITRTSFALGCEIAMTVLHEDISTANQALDAAFAQVVRIEKVMSIYSPSSDLCRLNRNGVLNDPDPYMVQVLEESRAISERSGGAFDVTVQPLWTLYAGAKEAGKLPSEAELLEARSKVDWRRIFISRNEIRLAEKGMGITLNGIAQGFAADRAAEAVREYGISNALLNTGEIASLGCKADGTPWLVGIQHPRREDAYIAVAKLDGRAMTTSGDYETRFTDDYVYNHIFEPWSGKSPGALASVSVVAPTATEADGLSTAIFVLGPEKGLALVRKSKDVDVFLVTKDERVLMTEGFPISRQ